MPPLVLSEDEVQQLQGIASSRSLPHSIVQRAQIVLACGAGETNTAIAKRMGLTGMTVGKWRKRYRELGLEGLRDELRPGRPKHPIEDQPQAALVHGLNQGFQGPVASKQWIHLQVVEGVVAVIGGGGEYRIQRQAGDPQAPGGGQGSRSRQADRRHGIPAGLDRCTRASSPAPPGPSPFHCGGIGRGRSDTPRHRPPTLVPWCLSGSSRGGWDRRTLPLPIPSLISVSLNQR